ncbi:MAG: hypothetical protein Q4G34_04705 [Micrococcus sp.]|nr:hypothetical protein [Micrococcus sp.]
MPSYRCRLEIGDLHPGHEPAEVMTMAEAALQATHEVAARDIEVVARVPRIVLRIAVPPSHAQAEDAEAWAAGLRMQEAVADIAQTGALTVLRRDGGRWVPVRV